MNMKNKHLKLRDCIIATPDVRSRDYFVLTTGPKKPLYTPVTGSSRTVVLEENVDWKDIIWGLERVRINKRLIHLRYLVFYPNS